MQGEAKRQQPTKLGGIGVSIHLMMSIGVPLHLIDREPCPLVARSLATTTEWFSHAALVLLR